MDGSTRWGALAFLAEQHEICGETVRMKEEGHSLFGQHRVRLYTFKKNVYWKIPAGVEVDISNVNPASGPPRRLPNR